MARASPGMTTGLLFAANRPASPPPSLPAVDLPAHQRDRLLIDLGRIPFLDRREIRLARLVTGAGAPAMGFEEIRGGSQRTGRGFEIADAVFQHRLGQELRLADLAMHRAALASR